MLIHIPHLKSLQRFIELKTLFCLSTKDEITTAVVGHSNGYSTETDVSSVGGFAE